MQLEDIPCWNKVMPLSNTKMTELKSFIPDFRWQKHNSKICYGGTLQNWSPLTAHFSLGFFPSFYSARYMRTFLNAIYSEDKWFSLLMSRSSQLKTSWPVDLFPGIPGHSQIWRTLFMISCRSMQTLGFAYPLSNQPWPYDPLLPDTSPASATEYYSLLKYSHCKPHCVCTHISFLGLTINATLL